MAAAASASVMRSGWLKKESEAKPGSLAKRWVVLDADLQLCCYKDTACDDLRCTVRCDGPEVRVSIVNGSYIQIDACVQNGQPLSSVTLKAETAAIALEWATRLSPLVLSGDYPNGSIEETQPHARSRRRSRQPSTVASIAASTAAASTYSAFSEAPEHSPAGVPGSPAAPSPGKAGRSRRSRKPHRSNPSEVSLGGVSSGGTHRVRREGRRADEQATAAGGPVLVANVTARAAAHQVTAAAAATTTAATAATAAAAAAAEPAAAVTKSTGAGQAAAVAPPVEPKPREYQPLNWMVSNEQGESEQGESEEGESEQGELASPEVVAAAQTAHRMRRTADQLASSLLCPITKLLMTDPVFTMDGQVTLT